MINCGKICKSWGDVEGVAQKNITNIRIIGIVVSAILITVGSLIIHQYREQMMDACEKFDALFYENDMGVRNFICHGAKFDVITGDRSFLSNQLPTVLFGQVSIGVGVTLFISTIFAFCIVPEKNPTITAEEEQRADRITNYIMAASVAALILFIFLMHIQVESAQETFVTGQATHNGYPLYGIKSWDAALNASAQQGIPVLDDYEVIIRMDGMGICAFFAGVGIGCLAGSLFVKAMSYKESQRPTELLNVL